MLRTYISDSVQFIGDSNDTAEIAQLFKEKCSGQTVWFPGSLKSKRIIQQHIEDACKVIDLPLYDTVKRLAKVTISDIYIFTSPLNVDSFFDENTINSEAEIWAIGKTTEMALKAYTDLTVRLPQRSSVKEILETICD